MSNSNTSPAVETPDFITAISNEIHTHRTLILCAALIVFGWHFSGRVLDFLSLHYSAQYQSDVATLKAQVASNQQAAAVSAAQAAQNAQNAADYKALAQQLAASNATLTAHEQATTAATTAQQATDKTLAPAALAQRWITLAGLQPDDIAPVQNGYVVSGPGALTTTQDLETIPELKSNLTDETALADNNGKLLAESQTLVTGLTTEVSDDKNQISGLNSQITEAGKACDDKISIIKTNDAKSKRKWFVAGYVAGVGTSVTAWVVKKLYF